LKKFIIFYMLFASTLFAREVRYLARSPRALLMGDAFTSLAGDEYTLFYNPAALARNEGVRFTALNPDISITNALDEEARFKDFPSNDPAAIAERLLGFPVHAHLGGTPTLKMGPFGFSLFVNSTTNLVLRNAVTPTLDIDYRLDRGFVIGAAPSFKLGSESQLAFGFGVKHMNRQGINKKIPLFGTELLGIITDDSVDSYQDIRRKLGYSKGSGWGVDLGALYTSGGKSGEFALGLSVMDLGDTRFKKEFGLDEVPKQEMNIAFGTSWSQDLGLLDYSVSFDIHPLNSPIAFGRKAHFGFQLNTPIVDLLGGWSGGYLSYGLSFKLWPFKLTLGIYSNELGVEYREEKGSRGIIYLSLFDFSFGD
jgi:hypothetical protein